MVYLQRNDHIVISQLHQLASQKSWVSVEAINAQTLILVSIALSAVLLDLTFKSSLPRSMCACTQWERSSLLLSHSVCLVRIFTFQALRQEKRCKYFVLVCACTLRVGVLGGVVVKALRYKPAGRRFDSRWCHWNFSMT